MYLKPLFMRVAICALAVVVQCNSLSSQTPASTESHGIVSQINDIINDIARIFGMGPQPLIQDPPCCRNHPMNCAADVAIKCVGFQTSQLDIKFTPHWKIGAHPDPNIANPDGPPCCYASPRPNCIASVARRCGGAAQNVTADRGLPWWLPGQIIPFLRTTPKCCPGKCPNNDACPPFAALILKPVDFEISEGKSITLQVASDLDLDVNFITQATVDRLGLSGGVFRLHENDTLPVQVAGADEIQITHILEANLFTGKEQYAIFGVLPPLATEQNDVADIMLGIDFVKNAGALHVDPTFFSGHGAGDGCHRGAPPGHQEL